MYSHINIAEILVSYHCRWFIHTLQGKLLHCEPPPGVDSVLFKPGVSYVKKEETHAHSEKQSGSTVSVLSFICYL